MDSKIETMLNDIPCMTRDAEVSLSIRLFVIYLDWNGAVNSL